MLVLLIFIGVLALAALLGEAIADLYIAVAVVSVIVRIAHHLLF